MGQTIVNIGCWLILASTGLGPCYGVADELKSTGIKSNFASLPSFKVAHGSGNKERQ